MHKLQYRVNEDWYQYIGALNDSFTQFQAMNSQDCASGCLNDSQCALALYKNSLGCQLWTVKPEDFTGSGMIGGLYGSLDVYVKQCPGMTTAFITNTSPF